MEAANSSEPEKVYCANCKAWEYRQAIELGKGSGWWLELTPSPLAIDFGPPKAFCSMRCLAEFACEESAVSG